MKIILSAIIPLALAGCVPPPQNTEVCVNALNGEHVQVVELGWGKKVRDAKGYEFWIEGKSQIWRCKLQRGA